MSRYHSRLPVDNQIVNAIHKLWVICQLLRQSHFYHSPMCLPDEQQGWSPSSEKNVESRRAMQMKSGTVRTVLVRPSLPRQIPVGSPANSPSANRNHADADPVRPMEVQRVFASRWCNPMAKPPTHHHHGQHNNRAVMTHPSTTKCQVMGRLPPLTALMPHCLLLDRR